MVDETMKDFGDKSYHGDADYEADGYFYGVWWGGGLGGEVEVEF